MIESEKLLQNKIKKTVIKKGVKLISSDSIYLSSDTKFGKNVLSLPFMSGFFWLRFVYMKHPIVGPMY